MSFSVKECFICYQLFCEGVDIQGTNYRLGDTNYINDNLLHHIRGCLCVNVFYLDFKK